jgi:glycosyltransferase involved in cell wall biosynthesis
VLQCLAEEADAVVHPSLEESFGWPLIEAMAQGLPVIAGKSSGGVSEVVQDGRTAILVDVRSPEALAQAMADLAQQPVLRANLGMEGLRCARQTFHLQTVLAQYRETYDQILGGHRGVTGSH